VGIVAHFGGFRGEVVRGCSTNREEDGILVATPDLADLAEAGSRQRALVERERARQPTRGGG
jgi:hypothetical protein